MEREREILLVFVRHGETEANREGIIQGSGCDFPLTEKGVKKCGRLKRLFYSLVLPVSGKTCNEEWTNSFCCIEACYVVFLS